MTKEFKPGTFVIHSHVGVEKIWYGVVKRMSNDNTKAFVWYHSGCTAASTPVEYLEECHESYAHRKCHRGCSHCMPTQFSERKE